jgi:tetratricopeptide (TPR) repeat protein
MFQNLFVRLLLGSLLLSPGLIAAAAVAKPAPKNNKLVSQISYTSCLTTENSASFQTVSLKTERNPETAKEFFDRAVALHNSGKLDCAIADYNQSIQLNPNSAVAYYNRGLAMQAKEEITQAIDDYNQALQLNPKLAGAYENRARALVKAGKYDRAIDDYNQALQLKPKSAMIYYSRGLAYQQKGHKQAAIADFQKAVEYASDVTMKKNARKRLQKLGAKLSSR